MLQLVRLEQGGPLPETPIWDRDDIVDGRLIAEFREECRLIRKCLEGDLSKVGSGTAAVARMHARTYPRTHAINQATGRFILCMARLWISSRMCR
jgi:hypothetical protein